MPLTLAFPDDNPWAVEQMSHFRVFGRSPKKNLKGAIIKMHSSESAHGRSSTAHGMTYALERG